MRDRLARRSNAASVLQDHQRNPTSATVLAAYVSLLVACAGKERTAMDYVEACRPGASVHRCTTMLAQKGTSSRFPAGHLNHVDVYRDRVVKERTAAGETIFIEGHRTFVHRLLHEHGHAEVCEVLRSELGEPNGRQVKHGDPHEGDVGFRPYSEYTLLGDYWKTEDGAWVCSYLPYTSVYWASEPFAIDPGDRQYGEFDPEIDRHVRPAPHAAALWRKLAQTLMPAAPSKE